MKKRIAFHSGSFDPFTNGHLDLLRRALGLFDEVVVGIGIHPGKTPMFDFEQRAEMIEKSLGQEQRQRTRITSFTGLAVEAARKEGASALVRGARDAGDFGYEAQMAGMNGKLAPEIETILLPASPESGFITATLVRQIARMGGDASHFVPAPVADALKARKDKT